MDAGSERAKPVAAASAPLLVLDDDAGAADPASRSGGRDSDLQRRYGAADMKVHGCATLAASGSITGEQCPSSFVVFGPYVLAPGGTDLHLSFEIEAKNELAVMSDIVSDGASRTHGALDEQELEPNERRRLGYRVHFFDPARAVEARIGIRSRSGAAFVIDDLALWFE
jgi:hypothetical protein